MMDLVRPLDKRLSKLGERLMIFCSLSALPSALFIRHLQLSEIGMQVAQTLLFVYLGSTFSIGLTLIVLWARDCFPKTLQVDMSRPKWNGEDLIIVHRPAFALNVKTKELHHIGFLAEIYTDHSDVSFTFLTESELTDCMFRHSQKILLHHHKSYWNGPIVVCHIKDKTLLKPKDMREGIKEALRRKGLIHTL